MESRNKGSTITHPNSFRIKRSSQKQAQRRLYNRIRVVNRHKPKKDLPYEQGPLRAHKYLEKPHGTQNYQFNKSPLVKSLRIFYQQVVKPPSYNERGVIKITVSIVEASSILKQKSLMIDILSLGSTFHQKDNIPNKSLGNIDVNQKMDIDSVAKV